MNVFRAVYARKINNFFIFVGTGDLNTDERAEMSNRFATTTYK